MVSRAVLGIDAAWTKMQPSGVALLLEHGARWKCLKVAPSYSAFCRDFRWEDPVSGDEPDIPALLAACRSLLGDVEVSVVAADIPLSGEPIAGRRAADNCVSQQFGARKCSTHSPSLERPGQIGKRLHRGFHEAGFPLVVAEGEQTPALLEVYPHVALLGLTGEPERLCYKASKTTTYWKELSAFQRKRNLVTIWESILRHLGADVDGIEIDLPSELDQLTFQCLKRYEDAIDALICAWMGTRYLAGGATPLGDSSAAIWVPKSL